jgi:hypothetical protein
VLEWVESGADREVLKRPPQAVQHDGNRHYPAHKLQDGNRHTLSQKIERIEPGQEY